MLRQFRLCRDKFRHAKTVQTVQTMLSPFILCPDKFRHVKTVQTAQTLLNPFILCPDKFRRAKTVQTFQTIRVITKLPNSEQSYKGKVKTHNYINRQNQSTTGKL